MGMPIVICCSEEDRAALADIAASVGADGNPVQFVEGVVADPKRLAPVIASLDRQGLYVLCRSKGLDRTTVEAMREILLAEQVPFSRTLTVATTRPSMVEDRIRSSLGRVLKATRARAAVRSGPSPATAKPDPAESPTANLGPPPGADDGPTLSGLDTPDTGVLNADRTGSMPAPEPPSSPAGLPPISARRGPPPPPPPPPPSTTEDSVVAPLPSASSVELRNGGPTPGDDSLAQMAASISDIDLSDLDYGDTSIGRAPEDPTGSAPRVETVITPAEALMQGNTVRARPPAADHMDPGGVTDPIASASIARAAPPPLPPTSPPPAPAHSSPSMSPSPSAPSASTAAAAGVAPGIPRVAWLAGGGLAMGLVALAIVCAVRDPEPDTDTKTVASKDDAPKSKASDASADGDPNESGDDGDDGMTPAAGADDGLVLEVEDGPPSAVLAAIQRRSVRALDILLVQAESAGVLQYQDAQDYCRTLEIDALVDWRLPDIGELHSISAADMLDSRTAYWSSTPADTFGDAHLAFVPRRSRVLLGPAKADVLCVRGDRATS